MCTGTQETNWHMYIHAYSVIELTRIDASGRRVTLVAGV